MNLDQRLTAIVRELIEAGVPLDIAKKEFDSKYVRVALAKTHGNVTQAAKLVGMHRNSLHHRTRTLLDRTRR